MQCNEVLCPFEGCSLTFKLKSSFSSHVTRNHRAGSKRQVSSHLLSHSGEHDTFSDENFNQDTDLGEGTHSDFDFQQQNDVEENFTELFLKNLALLYLKLKTILQTCLVFALFMDVLILFQGKTFLLSVESQGFSSKER